MDPNHPIDVDLLSSDSSDGSDNDWTPELVEWPTYKCKYCPKRFSTAQALGGHQNAHKKERQDQAMLTGMNQPHPDPYPYPPPPGFEQPRYIIDGPDNLNVVGNQGMDQHWAARGNSYQPVTALPQLYSSPTSPPPPPPLPPSPVNLNLCLGVGDSSQVQAQSKEPTEDGLSLSLSLKF